MRQIYTSPRLENIDRAVALLAEHGISTRVSNRAPYKRRSYDRFCYSARNDRDGWPVVEVVRAADLTAARKIMRQIGIEPPARYAQTLEAMRNRHSGNRGSRQQITQRVRIIVLAALAVAMLVSLIKAIKVF